MRQCYEVVVVGISSNCSASIRLRRSSSNSPSNIQQSEPLAAGVLYPKLCSWPVRESRVSSAEKGGG